MPTVRLAALLALAALVSCGDDGAGADAAVDAPWDARLLDGANAGLGMPCLNESSCAGTTAPACVSADGDPADDGFCSVECGIYDHGILVQDDSVCRNVYAGTIGVPACVLADGSPASRYYCGILCGPDPETAIDDGPCPGGLACLVSIDLVMDPGKELCSD